MFAMIQKKEDIVIIIYSHFKNSYKNCDILRQQQSIFSSYF